MIAQADLTEYLDEIRQNVCSRCVERPEGGPPCMPRGKNCGVEMHLADLVDSIHQVRSNRIQPYLDNNREEICEKCALLHSSICPCPMDYLAVLVVQAVETVDARRGQRRERLARAIEMEELRRVYQEATGTWTGCDWPTAIGKTGLNVQGWTANQARAVAQALQTEGWSLAADWLAQVEHHAQVAERKAAEAIEAAGKGRWRDALLSAEWAWSLEFSTGRPLRHGPPLAWERLREVIEAAYLAHELADVSSGDIPS
jgi:hypothetical protein